jgi:DNA-binding MarR family transcriptional regulator
MAFPSEDYLGYWLFYAQRSVAYAFYEALKAHCEERGKLYTITPPQWGLLSLLDEQDRMTIGAISRRLAVDAPTVTGIVKRLEQSGLVERRHDLEDRRQVMVYLTEEGRDIMRSLPDAVNTFAAIMTRGFSKEQLRDLTVMLQRIIVNLEDVGPGTGDRFRLIPDFTRLEYQERKPTHE